ncbi:hypothetical protein [Massilia sp. Root351]|uniref:hypothetical protein n=1 Tax=Massilia sp. Root351 TaxID=1736522 RepID=UPI000A59FC50|nr:hypothetical protein [Massilia sp. Root351]
MCRTPTARQLCQLLAAGWLAAGAPLAFAAAIADGGSSGGAPAAAVPAIASAPRSTPASPTAAQAAATPAPTGPSAAFEALDQTEPQLLAAAGSVAQGYVTPASFSKPQAYDHSANRLHLPRQDADLDSLDPFKGKAAKADEGMNPALLWLSILGLATAAISGILQYARNPITRKRKYRNYDRTTP